MHAAELKVVKQSEHGANDLQQIFIIL